VYYDTNTDTLFLTSLISLQTDGQDFIVYCLLNIQYTLNGTSVYGISARGFMGLQVGIMALPITGITEEELVHQNKSTHPPTLVIKPLVNSYSS
jgi:hypothetical protein